MTYIVGIVIFIIFFSSIIKNHTKTFRDIGFIDISHKCHLDYIVTVTYVTKGQ